ncbi:hypothetical protein GCM10027594_15190 [Hymenobacter agri]
MPAPRIRCPKPLLVAADSFSAEESPAAGPALPTSETDRRRVLRVGDYEVGEVGCPRLGGHPGIRY